MKEATAMNETIQNLISRRSCRAYTNTPVDSKALEEILKAGTYAPTGMGKQSPLMVVIETPETLEKVEKLNATVVGNPEAHTFYGAPIAIVIFGDPTLPFGIADGNLVIGNLLNAANAVGVDSCYIWRAKESFESEEGQALKKEWGIPDHYVGIGNVILGYGAPGGKKEAPARKDDYIRRV